MLYGMDEVFLERPVLDKAQRAALREPNDALSARHLMLQLIWMGGTLAATVLVPDPWRWVAFALHGTAHLSMFALLHESCHNTVFRARSLNVAAGWIAALSQPMSPALMRAFHFTHHRHTHQLDKDPELGGIAFMLDWPRHVFFLTSLTGLPLIGARVVWSTFAAVTPSVGPFGALWDKVLPFVKPKERRRIGWEARALLLVHAGLIAAAVMGATAAVWFYAGMFLGHAYLGAYVTCEHRGLPSDGDIFARTRSIDTIAPLKWLLWNMPYHAEHHAWPAIPWHALPKVHELVRDELPERASITRLYLTRGARQGGRTAS